MQSALDLLSAAAALSFDNNNQRPQAEQEEEKAAIVADENEGDRSRDEQDAIAFLEFANLLQPDPIPASNGITEEPEELEEVDPQEQEREREQEQEEEDDGDQTEEEVIRPPFSPQRASPVSSSRKRSRDVEDDEDDEGTEDQEDQDEGDADDGTEDEDDNHEIEMESPRQSSLPPLPPLPALPALPALVITSLPPLPPPHLVPEDAGVIRCVCPFTSDDGYTIQCDGCNAWQHLTCVMIDVDNVPDEYRCELCDPTGARDRGVDSKRAEEDQRRRMLEEGMRAQRELMILGNNGGIHGDGPRQQQHHLHPSNKRRSLSTDRDSQANNNSTLPPSTNHNGVGPGKRRRGGGAGAGSASNRQVSGSAGGRSKATPSTSAVVSSSISTPISTATTTTTTQVTSNPVTPHLVGGDLQPESQSRLASLGLLRGNQNGWEEEEDQEPYETWQYEFTPVEKNLWKNKEIVTELMEMIMKDRDENEGEEVEETHDVKKEGETPDMAIARLLTSSPLITLPSLPPSIPTAVKQLLPSAFHLTPQTCNSYMPSTTTSTPACPYPRPTLHALFSTCAVPAGRFITTLCGEINSLANYTSDPLNQYTSLGTGKQGVRFLKEPWSLVVDQRQFGNMVRFARSGCHPNAMVKIIHLTGNEDSKADITNSNNNNTPWADQRLGNDIVGKVQFAIYSLTDIGKKEEIILPWDWNDHHLIHTLPLLMSSPPLTPSLSSSEPNLEKLSKKMGEVASTLLGVGTTYCACEKKRDCSLFWLCRAASAVPTSLSRAQIVKREPFTTIFLNAIASGGRDEFIQGGGAPGGRAKQRKGKKPDLGPLLGLQRDWEKAVPLPPEVEIVEEVLEPEVEDKMQVDEEVREEEDEDDEQKETAENDVSEPIAVEDVVSSPIINKNAPELPSIPIDSLEPAAMEIDEPVPLLPPQAPAADGNESDGSDLTEPLSHASDDEDAPTAPTPVRTTPAAQVDEDDDEDDEEDQVKPPPRRSRKGSLSSSSRKRVVVEKETVGRKGKGKAVIKESDDEEKLREQQQEKEKEKEKLKEKEKEKEREKEALKAKEKEKRPKERERKKKIVVVKKVTVTEKPAVDAPIRKEKPAVVDPPISSSRKRPPKSTSLSTTLPKSSRSPTPALAAATSISQPTSSLPASASLSAADKLAAELFDGPADIVTSVPTRDPTPPPPRPPTPPRRLTLQEYQQRRLRAASTSTPSSDIVMVDTSSGSFSSFSWERCVEILTLPLVIEASSQAPIPSIIEPEPEVVDTVPQPTIVPTEPTPPPPKEPTPPPPREPTPPPKEPTPPPKEPTPPPPPKARLSLAAYRQRQQQAQKESEPTPSVIPAPLPAFDSSLLGPAPLVSTPAAIEQVAASPAATSRASSPARFVPDIPSPPPTRANPPVASSQEASSLPFPGGQQFSASAEDVLKRLGDYFSSQHITPVVPQVPRATGPLSYTRPPPRRLSSPIRIPSPEPPSPLPSRFEERSPSYQPAFDFPSRAPTPPPVTRASTLPSSYPASRGTGLGLDAELPTPSSSTLPGREYHRQPSQPVSPLPYYSPQPYSPPPAHIRASPSLQPITVQPAYGHNHGGTPTPSRPSPPVRPFEQRVQDIPTGPRGVNVVPTTPSVRGGFAGGNGRVGSFGGRQIPTAESTSSTPSSFASNPNANYGSTSTMIPPSRPRGFHSAAPSVPPTVPTHRQSWPVSATAPATQPGVSFRGGPATRARYDG